MGTRASSMADISQYLASSSEAEAPLPALDTSVPADVVGAPEIAEEKQQKKEESKTQEEIKRIEEDKQSRASIKEMQKAQLQAEERRKHQQQQAAREAVDTAKTTTFAITSAINRSVQKVGDALASVPVPGSLLLPLSLLLLFFFALIVVNGHTRLSWLWLVLTGNASLGATAGQATTTGGNVEVPPFLPGGKQPPPSNVEVPPFLPGHQPSSTSQVFPLPPRMTGVQEIT